jgi:uncharacterized protein YndB with AHSA1/START domain
MMQMDTTEGNPARMVEGNTLVIQRWLPGPADRVWRYLVDGEKRRKWLAAGEMELAAGAVFELVWRNDDLSAATDPRPEGFPEVQRLQSRVVAVDPPKRLVIGWGAGEVSFELDDRGERVLLTVRHSGLSAGPVRAEIAGGWHMHLDILADRLSDRAPASFWAGWARLRDQYADLTSGEQP